MSFGSTIKRLRKEKGYTQDQLANLLSVTPQAISRWENDSAMPDISLLIPIANVFSVSTDTLLEVDIARNHEHIADFAENALTFSPPYGSKMAEKLAIYRDEVRKYPDSIELREALYQILTHYVSLTGSFKDPTITREMRCLLRRHRRVGLISEISSMAYWPTPWRMGLLSMWFNPSTRV